MSGEPSGATRAGNGDLVVTGTTRIPGMRGTSSDETTFRFTPGGAVTCESSVLRDIYADTARPARGPAPRRSLPQAPARGRSAIDRGAQTRHIGPVPPLRRLAPRVLVREPGAVAPAFGDDTIVLPQCPGPAFGDGSHPTTRLCAGAVDLLARRLPPPAVLDVGTGTGVLARIARARGAAFVAATDIDPAALAAARANAGLDGGARPIEICGHSPDHWGPRFALVVANILEGPLLALAPALAGALAPGGALLLSGFTPPQVPTLRAAFERRGLDFVSQAGLDGWCLLRLDRGGRG